MEKIAVIGVGALGRRHLQSLIELDREVKLYAVENNPATLNMLIEEFNIKGGDNVIFLQDVGKLPSELDLVVIATSSNVRRLLFEKLTDRVKVKNIIFEKVLFQRVEDYYFVKKRLTEKNINAWVNCARREWDSYHQLKEKVRNCSGFTFSVVGGQWGLGCNAIHMLDLIEFLSEGKCRVDLSGLLPEIVESKRSGFYEFFGSITGNCGKCYTYQLTCMNATDLPFAIEIAGDSFRAIINEQKRKIYISEKENNWNWEKRPFEVPFQSQLTRCVADSILEKGNCRLVEYDDSMELHLNLMMPLIQYFEKQGMEEGICPIT